MNPNTCIGLVLMLVGVMTASAQMPPELRYQDRGGYHEGIQPGSVSGDNITLLGAEVRTREDRSLMPGTLNLQFFLPNESDVFITVREKLPRVYYLLNRVQPRRRPAGYGNRFQWGSAPVLAHYPQLRMADLSVLARLDHELPGGVERIAPVLFFSGTAPSRAKEYSFTFQTAQDAALVCQVYSGANKSGDPLELPAVARARPYVFVWKSGSAADGEYRLVITGRFTTGSQSTIDKTVIFYHRTQVGGS